jgi:hypothetical protein
MAEEAAAAGANPKRRFEVEEAACRGPRVSRGGEDSDQGRREERIRWREKGRKENK